MTRERDRFDEFYRRKWEGHDGLWEERYPADQVVYATSVYRRRNEAISRSAVGAMTALDIGCGVGDLTLMLDELGISMVAGDVAAENVRRTRVNLLQHGVPARVVRHEGEHLPFEDSSFDLVVVADVIEHVVSVSATLREVRRVLRPGGRLICVTPVRGTLQAWRLADWFARSIAKPWRRPSWPGFRHEAVLERFLSKRELREAICRSGLRPTIFQRICFYPAPETAGAFGAVMRRLHEIRGPHGFENTSLRVIRAFDALSRLGVFNQKQLWVAKKRA